MSDERSSGYYARIMGTFWRHPRTSGLSLAARGLWVSLVSWSADQRSDGDVPVHALAMACGGRADARALAELERCDLVTRDGPRLVLRNWAKHNITREKHDKEKERARNGMANKRSRSPVVTRNEASNETVSEGQPSDQDQDQDQEQTRSTERVFARAEPEPPDDGTPQRAASLTERAERVRKQLTKAYEVRGLVVPTMDLSVPHSGHVLDLTRAFDARSDLGSCIEGFFSDDKAAAAGFPVGWLAKNPNQYLAKRPRNAKNPRANSEYRDRVLTMDELLDGAGEVTNG